MKFLTRRRLQFAAASTLIQLLWGTAATAQDLVDPQRHDTVVTVASADGPGSASLFDPAAECEAAGI